MPKNHYSLLIIIALFVTLGCNLLSQDSGDPATEKTEADSPGQTAASPEPGNKNDVDKNVPSTDVAEIEFPSDEKESDNTEKKPGGPRTTIVRFVKGTTSRSYTNEIDNGGSHTYVLGASRGQTMSIDSTIGDFNANFSVFSPGGRRIHTTTSGKYRFKLPASGKYRIVVTVASPDGNGEYGVRFGVTGGSESGNSTTIESRGGLTTVVRFRKGATTATYRNAVIRGERNRYILGASAGQLMSVSIRSIENNAVFDIQAPGGRTLVREVRNWSGQLPSNGKYRIIVGGTRGNATYTVRFAVR